MWSPMLVFVYVVHVWAVDYIWTGSAVASKRNSIACPSKRFDLGSIGSAALAAATAIRAHSVLTTTSEIARTLCCVARQRAAESSCAVGTGCRRLRSHGEEFDRATRRCSRARVRSRYASCTTRTSSCPTRLSLGSPRSPWPCSEPLTSRPQARPHSHGRTKVGTMRFLRSYGGGLVALESQVRKLGLGSPPSRLGHGAADFADDGRHRRRVRGGR